MSEIEFEDYKKYPDSYFGVIHKQGKNIDNDYDFFDNWVNVHMSYSKESTLKKMENSRDYERLKPLDKKELVVEYCERFMGTIINRRKRLNIIIMITLYSLSMMKTKHVHLLITGMLI